MLPWEVESAFLLLAHQYQHAQERERMEYQCYVFGQAGGERVLEENSKRIIVKFGGAHSKRKILISLAGLVSS